MNTQNFSIQSSLEANYLNIQLEEPIQIDEIAVKTIANDCPEFLIPFQLLEVNGSLQLKYKLINTIALEYIDTSYTKKDFIKLFMNLLNPLIKGKEWFLDYHCFCINPQYVYVDRISNLVSYIYIPEASYRNTDSEIFDFVKNTFNKLTITDDAKFQVDMFHFFAKSGVTLIDLYKLLQNEQSSAPAGGYGQAPAAAPAVPAYTAPAPAPAPAPVVAPAPAPAPAPAKPEKEKPSFFGSKKEKEAPAPAPVPAPAPAPAPGGNNDEIIDQLFGGSSSGKKKDKKEDKKEEKQKEKEKKKGGLFGKKEKKEDDFLASVSAAPAAAPAPAPAPAPQPASFGQPVQDYGMKQEAVFSPDEGVTATVDDFVSRTGMPHLELISSPLPGAPARIDLDISKPYISIGRMSSDEIKPDIAFPSDFKFVGRKHARISSEGGKFCLIDLGSKNHTFLNGNMLVPNQPYELSSGAEITFTESMPVKYRVIL